MGNVTSSIQTNVGFDQPEALVVRLKEGDENAFNEVFELYRDLVYTLSVKLLADKAEAMDVTQEVFLTLFRKIGSFRGDCSLKTWLYRVTLNQAANKNRWWKRRFRSRTVSLGLASNDEEPAPVLECGQPGPDRRVISGQLHEAIQKGLRTLPFEQRAAVVLRDVQGLSYEEIAQVAAVNVGTVKSRIARGRERLRGVLRDFRSRGVSG